MNQRRMHAAAYYTTMKYQEYHNNSMQVIKIENLQVEIKFYQVK